MTILITKSGYRITVVVKLKKGKKPIWIRFLETTLYCHVLFSAQTTATGEIFEVINIILSSYSCMFLSYVEFQCCYQYVPNIFADFSTPHRNMRRHEIDKCMTPFFYTLRRECRWWEIDIHGCYSLVKIAFVLICAYKNDRRIWRHIASTHLSRDVTDQLWWRHNTKWEKTVLSDNGEIGDR